MGRRPPFARDLAQVLDERDWSSADLADHLIRLECAITPSIIDGWLHESRRPTVEVWRLLVDEFGPLSLPWES
jgi:hypothetical protein